MERFAKEHEVPISQIETIRFIELLIRIGKVKRVFEVGAAIGYSEISMAYAGAEKSGYRRHKRRRGSCRAKKH